MKTVTCPSWNPYQAFTWTTTQMRAWADQYGGSAFYDGELWGMNWRRICPGKYTVTFTEVE